MLVYRSRSCPTQRNPVRTRIQYAELAKETGIAHYRVVPALNEHPLLVRALTTSSCTQVTSHEAQQSPVVLVFAGNDPTGGAGIQADIETLASSAVIRRRWSRRSPCRTPWA